MVTNCAEFIFLPDLSGTGPLLTLADLDHAILRMSVFHQTKAFRRNRDGRVTRLRTFAV